MSGLYIPEWFFSPVIWVAMGVATIAVVTGLLWLSVKVVRAIWRGWR